MTTPRADPAARSALLDAGLYLAQRMPLSQVNGALIAQAAGLAPQDFDTHFGDLNHYLLDLQARFMEELRARVVQATMQAAAGAERLCCAIETYLDVCLEHVPLRAWLVERRYTNTEIAEALRQRNRGYVHLITAEFAAMGWRHPPAAAQLLMAMNQETALAEHQSRQKLPEYRAVLADFVRGPAL